MVDAICEHDTIPVKVYRFYNKDNQLLYVGVTADLEMRTYQHKGNPWWHEVARTEYEVQPNRALGLLREREYIQTEKPLHNGPWAFNFGTCSRPSDEVLDTIRPTPYKGHKPKEGEKNVYFHINIDIWNTVKAAAALQNTTVKEYVTRALTTAAKKVLEEQKNKVIAKAAKIEEKGVK